MKSVKEVKICAFMEKSSVLPFFQLLREVPLRMKIYGDLLKYLISCNNIYCILVSYLLK